ncbi:uncharacterized protein ARB_07225 [Trichophyton benhamiae CBS 112371]|uniref:non-specific serine/threonine protein kinase n=1 Tax=Arthroderma benhamiae (strain ATCC MYA-4681 / CBS 112371) TaxID=663331 RepID=D4ASL0_ARTBC|nr:uncharacterized protein ARB_07225 [Trichophyton benhamiae CBS 112371]EFE33760.1 hypothetical protein ARB_07225 [Trichophyton benhamiae CBS 112371]
MEENSATSNTPKYEYIEGCERLERYSPGGYHPVKIGDQLCHGRYNIVQFLGHGGSSTVWLALDKVKQQLVAVKIKTADSTDQEEEIMAELRDMPLIRQLQDVFVEHGPNGTHRCLVMETGLCSLRVSKVMSAHELLYLSTARAIIAELVLTVQSLHDRGIVHGDIHGGNILLRLPEDIRQITDATTLYQRFGEPITKPVVRVDRQPLDVGVPTHVYWPIRLSVRSDKIMDSHLPIMLSDFTSSYYPSQTRQMISRTLPHIVPPEAFSIDEHKKEESLCFPSEIWTLACTVFDILGGGGLFSDQASALGKFPEPWWSRWEERAEFFTEDGVSIEFPNSGDSLEDRYDWFVTAARRRYKMEYPDEEEKKAFLQMIGPMLRYFPGERASIRDVVNSEWMQKWALPCLHRNS